MMEHGAGSVEQGVYRLEYETRSREQPTARARGGLLPGLAGRALGNVVNCQRWIVFMCSVYKAMLTDAAQLVK